MKKPLYSPVFRASMVLGCFSVLALSGCGKEVKRSGESVQKQNQPRTVETHPQNLVPSSRPSTEPTEQPSPSPRRNCEAGNPTGPNQKGPNQKGPNQKGSRPADCENEPDTRPTTRPTTRPSTRPTTRPSTRPSGQPTSTPAARCADPTVVPANVSRSSYSALVNGKAGTWQLVDFKAHAAGAVPQHGSGALKRAKSSIQGEALGSVNVWPLCDDLTEIPMGDFNWKMSMPLFIGSKDGYISEEIRYRETLAGDRSASSASSQVEIKTPTTCKVVTGTGNSAEACGSWDYYSEASGKLVLVRTRVIKDSQGTALTVRTLGRYAWVSGERLLGRLAHTVSARTSPGTVARRDYPVTDIGEVSGDGHRSANSSDLGDEWDYNESSNNSNTVESSVESDVWEDEFAVSGSDSVVYVGERPCACRVLTKKEVRKVRRQVRRALRHAYRACR